VIHPIAVLTHLVEREMVHVRDDIHRAEIDLSKRYHTSDIDATKLFIALKTERLDELTNARQYLKNQR
jgi:hypothetical protein